jgi:4-hydroxy-4-methyl-2-oxoglutarate aldolase
MTRHRIVRAVPRAQSSTIAALAAAGVATVHEAIGRVGLLDAGIRPIQDLASIAGSAVTVSCQPGDNLMIHAAVEQVGNGDVLVVATTSPSTDGMIGELLATSLQARGCSGLVIDAGVRDKAALTQMGFPAWTRAVHAQGTSKTRAGSVNTPIACGGQLVDAGDVVVADDDGVCIVPWAGAEVALAAAAARLDKEAKTRRALAAGELGLDLYGLRTTLSDLGVEYVDIR